MTLPHSGIQNEEKIALICDCADKLLGSNAICSVAANLQLDTKLEVFPGNALLTPSETHSCNSATDWRLFVVVFETIYLFKRVKNSWREVAANSVEKYRGNT